MVMNPEAPCRAPEWDYYSSRRAIIARIAPLCKQWHNALCDLVVATAEITSGCFSAFAVDGQESGRRVGLGTAPKLPGSDNAGSLTGSAAGEATSMEMGRPSGQMSHGYLPR